MMAYAPRESMNFATNDNYWGGKPVIREIIFKLGILTGDEVKRVMAAREGCPKTFIRRRTH